MSFSLGIELEGYDEAQAMLQRAIRGLRHPGPAMAGEFPILEAEEQHIFDALHGRYVDTGRTMRSLTEPGGPDAVRVVTSDELIFGTSVPYAPYLTKEEAEGKHTGGSAILVEATEEAVLGADERIIDRMLEGL
jgi:hypothetical protein